jgi:CheY-like chemotaxis protein
MSRILIVDDETSVRDLVRIVLEGKGYAVCSAANGKEALEKIQAARPDLVVLDLTMPVLDGWGVLEELRRTPGAPPVVVLSGMARLVQHPPGPVAWLSKPFRIGELLQTCAKALAA